MTGSSSISACLIVRNEEAMLEDCLRSLRGVASEIVLIDTGSTDRTLQIARNYPVSIHERPWVDDFSVARNHALDLAQADWILSIDADERLDFPSGFDVGCLLERDDVLGYKLRLHERSDLTPFGALRLWKNSPDIRYEGRIHEHVRGAIGRATNLRGKSIQVCDLELRHVGYDGDQTAKHARNKELLIEELRINPDRAYCWWHLGQIAEVNGDRESAERAWHRGIQAVRAQSGQHLELSEARPFISMIGHMFENGDDVAATIVEAYKLFPSHRTLQLFNANLLVNTGRAEDAIEILEFLSEIDADSYFDSETSYPKSLFSYGAREGLGMCYYVLERFEDAVTQFRRAAAATNDPDACMLMARLADARSKSKAEGVRSN